MKRHPYFYSAWYGINFLLFVSLAALIYGIGWEASTRSYLRGFADAIVPASAAPEQKVESILVWMARGPARRTATAQESLSLRDPEETLNYGQLLHVCGTATNAFVNLAASSGLKARRLLLLDSNYNTKHVVAEVLVNGRWIIVDPSYRVIFRGGQGQFLTKENLRDPTMFREATQVISDYPQSYTYERTVIVRLQRIPIVGPRLRALLKYIYPDWEQEIDWTLLVERDSFALVAVAGLLLCCSMMARFILSWYGDKRLGVPRIRLRTQLRRVGDALLTAPK